MIKDSQRTLEPIETNLHSTVHSHLLELSFHTKKASVKKKMKLPEAKKAVMGHAECDCIGLYAQTHQCVTGHVCRSILTITYPILELAENIVSFNAAML